MKSLKLLLLLLLLVSAPALSQTNAPALISQRGTTLPSVCTVGQLFFKTNATAGQNVYECAATNTWTQEGGGGAASITVGSTTISGGSTGQFLYDNAGVLGEQALPTLTALNQWAPLYVSSGSGAGTITSPSAFTGLQLNSSSGAPAAYGGTSCTNQFPRSLNASGAATCATVSLTADITGTLATGNGGTGVTDLTFSGNTHKAASVSGAVTNAHCAQWDASGNITDSGAGCGGGGAGTFTSISASQSVTFTGYEAVTAAGSTQGAATALDSAKVIHNITTATNNQGVILPAATVGLIHIVKNSTGTSGANLKVYPATGEQIGALGANAALSLIQGTSEIFVASGTGTWIIIGNLYPDGAGFSSSTNVTGNNTLGLSGSQTFTTMTVTNPVWKATAPTLSSGGCTSPSAVTANGTLWFKVTVGTGCSGSQPLVFTLPSATNGWNCHAQDTSNSAGHAPAQSSAISTTSVTITDYSRTTGLAQAWVDNDVVVVSCLGG